MSDVVYVQLMEKVKPLSDAVIEAHRTHLKTLEEGGRLVLCGPFTDYPGGMVVLRAASLQEAENLVAADPLIAEGYESFSLRTLEIADASTGY